MNYTLESRGTFEESNSRGKSSRKTFAGVEVGSITSKTTVFVSDPLLPDLSVDGNGVASWQIEF